jgi:hypothetical protein
MARFLKVNHLSYLKNALAYCNAGAVDAKYEANPAIASYNTSVVNFLQRHG